MWLITFIVELYRAKIWFLWPATLPAWCVHCIRETSVFCNEGENKVVEIITGAE